METLARLFDFVSGFPLLTQGQAPGLWRYLLLGVFSLAHGYLATIVGAIAASEGELDPWLVFASVSAAHLAADNLWYFLGRLLGLGGISLYGGKLGIKRDRIESIVSGSRAYLGRLLFLSKLTSGVTIPVLIAVGIARVAWRKAFAIAAAGELLRTGLIMLLSYRFAVSVGSLSFLARTTAIAGGVLVALGAGYYFHRLVKIAAPAGHDGKGDRMR